MDRKKMKKGCLIFMLILFLLIPLLIGADCLAEPYCPLREGMVLEYQIRTMQGKTETGSFYLIRKALAPRKLNDKKVVPLQDQKGNLLFIVEDDIGIGVYATQTISDIEPKILQSIDYFLKYPLKVGTTDKRSQKTVLLDEKVDVDITMTIETLTDTVTVPAGTFENCLRIKYSGKKALKVYVPSEGTAIVEIEIFEWYAKNIGLIKSIRSEKASNLFLGWPQQRILQLVKFTK